MDSLRLSRRSFLTLSTASMAATALSGCFSFFGFGSDDEERGPAAEPIEVRFATDWVEGARGATMDAAMTIWLEQSPDTLINLEPIEGDYFGHLQSQFASDSVADVLLFEGVLGAEYIRDGLLADLSPTLDGLGIDFAKWRPGPVDIFLQEGKIYAIPFQLTPALWFYNKTLFEEKGVALPDGTWDWARTLDAAQQLTDGTNTFGMLTEADMFHQYGALGLANSDHHWVNDEFTQTLVGEENFAAAIRWLISTVQEFKVSPAPAEVDYLLTDDIDDPFATGKVGMITGNAGSIGRFTEEIGDRFEWDVMPTPKGPDSGRGGGMWNDQPHVVTTNAAQRNVLEEATQLVVFLAGDEVQSIIARDRGATPTVKMIQESDDYLAAPPNNMQTVLDELIEMKGPRFFPRFLEWLRVVNGEYEKGLTGWQSADEAIEAMVTKGDEVLDKIER